MKSISILSLVITNLVNYTFAYKMKGSQSSYAYFSNKKPFRYSEIEDLIAFGYFSIIKTIFFKYII